MNVLRIMLAITGGLFCAGCHTKIDRADLAGTFTANTATYRDIIDIRDDGTYVHTCHLDPQGMEITSTNKWAYETSDGVTRITFQGFVWGMDFIQPNLSKEQRGKPSFWDVEVEKSFRTLRLRINPDVHQFYVKKRTT
jgi:hypothetical protein